MNGSHLCHGIEPTVNMCRIIKKISKLKILVILKVNYCRLNVILGHHLGQPVTMQFKIIIIIVISIKVRNTIIQLQEIYFLMI